MRDYGKIFSAIWESADFRGLTEDGRTLVLYLLSCRHGTLAGVFRLPDGYAAEDLQWKPERVAKGFADLQSKGFATRCKTTMWVWVTKFLEWNPLENPNQRKAAAKIAQSVPVQCDWKPAFMRVCGQLMGIEPPPAEPPRNNGLGTLAEGSPNQYQEQYQEQEQKQEQECGGAVATTALPTKAMPAADAPATTAERGKRLPKEWRLPKAWGDWALAKYPLWTAQKVRDEGDKFRNHWVGKTGKDATKLDWEGTWQNWCMSSIAHRDDPKPSAAAGINHAERGAALERALGYANEDVIDA